MLVSHLFYKIIYTKYFEHIQINNIFVFESVKHNIIPLYEGKHTNLHFCIGAFVLSLCMRTRRYGEI
uniref:Uncharacterized protein n=1 Tax=Prevotella sp. GTC17259 TaxID=3236795 RepID=A0AB33J1B2_9BACT